MKKTALVAVILLLVLIPVAFWWFCLRPVPAMYGREQIAGLEKDVVVRFDGHAVPYIESRSEDDAYVAQGYVTARERMFQMDMLRRSANGQMAEVFGNIALPTDRLVRTLNIKGLAFQEFQRLSPPARRAVDAYARGVNAYLSEYTGRLGIEFTLLGYTPARWFPEDSLAILKHMGYRTDESWRLDDFRQRVTNKLGEKQAAALFRDDLAFYGLPPKPVAKPAPASPAKPGTTTSPALPASPVSPVRPTTSTPSSGERRTISQVATPESEDLLADLAAFGEAAHAGQSPRPNWGSTAFAIPNNHSRSGGSLLACDKHGALTTPAEWFLCSINAPTLHAAGATIPGVPGIWIGRNEDISWGSAALKADVQDIYLEHFNDEHGTSYRIGDRWFSAEVRTELIPVRLGKAIEHKVIITRHGPVLFRTKDAAISLAWTGASTEKPTFDALWGMNHARSWDEFTAALTKYVDPPQMFVYADRWGNAGCQAAGLIPTRSNATQGTMLAAGTDAKNRWESYIPFDKLPQSFAPAGSTTGSAYFPLVGANQKPSVSSSALPKMASSLILGHQWNAPYRANRLLLTLTQAKAPIGAADINVLQGDEYSPVVPILAKALESAATQTHYIDRNGLQAIDLLGSWDGQLKAHGVEASIYEAFLQTLMRRAIEPAIGRDMATEYLSRWPMWMPLAESIVRDRPAGWMPPEERSYDAFFLTTLTQAMKSLKVTFAEPDPAKWVWGKIHTAGFRHVSPNATPLFQSFALGPVPVGGTSETLNSCDVQPDPRALHYNSESGPTQRMIVDMADRDKFYQALATGQSGHRFSPYRDDQLKAWRRVDLAPIAFSADQMFKQAKYRIVLENKYGM